MTYCFRPHARLGGFLISAAFFMPLDGQEVVRASEISLSERLHIPEPVLSDSLEDPVTTEPVVPEFAVLSSYTKRRYVVEAPPMPGLPPVEGPISVTVQQVLDPGIPDPEPSSPAPPQEGSEIQNHVMEFPEDSVGQEMIFVSGQTYDHSRSMITVYPQGRDGGSVTCWSNLDLAQFSGWTEFHSTKADGTQTRYSLLMGYSQIDTEKVAALADRAGHAYEAPEIPALPDLGEAGPAFMIVDQRPNSDEAVATLQRLHVLYLTEGERLKVMWRERAREQEERRARYLADPPKPEDVTMRFWRRNAPLAKEGGAR